MHNKQIRENWIDCARGFAIILVVLGHIDLGQNPLCRWISSFHMPVFFLLSGILIASRDSYAERPLLHTLGVRAKRLLYPYLTLSLLTVLYNLLAHGPQAAASVLRDTVTLEGHGVMWFLPALFAAECMLLMLLKSRIPNALGGAALAAGTTLYAALQYYAIGGAVPAQVGLRYQILNFFCRAGIGAVFMLAGFAGYRRRSALDKLGKRRILLAAALMFSLGFACCWLNAMPDMHYSVLHNPVLYYLSALLQGGALILFCAYALRRCAVLEFFGRNSLIVMATHYSFPVIRYALQLTAPLHTGLRYLDDLTVCAAVMLSEALFIIVIQTCAPFMLRIPAHRKKPCKK